MRSLIISTMAALLLGCGQPTALAPRLVQVRVEDDRGAALAGVAVELDGIIATTTGRDGVARVSLGADGMPRARVAVLCPPKFRSLAPRHIARLRTGSAPPLELSFRCRPKLRTVVVVARVTNGEGLMVRADGAPIGTIGTDGTLHARLLRPPQSDLRLMVDTADRALTPRNPAREFRIADQDELLVFDERLTSVRARVSRITPEAPKRAPPPLPYAIRSDH